MSRERIEVSPEMLAYVGEGTLASAWPDNWVVLQFDGLLGPATMACGMAPLSAELVFAVDPSACVRLFGAVPEPDRNWHLPSELRAIALAIRDCPLTEPARSTLRLAKSIELLCAAMTRLTEGRMVSANGGGALNARDAQLVLAARQFIDERWREKLTLEAIARAAGLNRAKLTRGFRALFDCSVAEALAEKRLGGARRMLRETDLPVASIGYACGYDNNASFTRAFSRRYGMPPTRLRDAELAA